MQEKIRRCTQVVVRGRTRNAIGPQGRVGSTPTISVKKAEHTVDTVFSAFFLFISIEHLYTVSDLAIHRKI